MKGDFWMLHESEQIADYVRDAVEKASTQRYQDGYTRGFNDGMKKAEQERTLDGVQPVVPQPCVRGIDMRTMKKLFLKLDEEVDEFKAELFQYMDDLDAGPEDVLKLLNENPAQHAFRIAEEGADVATMIATICNAVGVDDKTRFEAQAYVNKHNQERGRL